MPGCLGGSPSDWGRRWATFLDRGGVWDGMATVGATSRTCAHTVGYGFGSLGGASPLVPADPRSTAAVRAWVPSDRAAGFLEKLRCTTQIGFPSGGLA